jgi:putative hydrolase of the HAD superfamily
MEIRQTAYSDLNTVMDIYDHAREYMRQNGNQHQWTDGYPSRELIMADIDAERSYVCTDEDQIVGIFCFTIGIDPTYINIYDGEWLDDNTYGVVHRIASASHKKGVASFCLDWCFDRCNNIKIDTHEDNVIMQKFLAKNGYRRCGTIYLENGDPRIAFQKNKTMINTVILDIGNVLAHFRWREYLEDCGYDADTRERVANATVLSGFWDEWDRGRQDEEELIARSVSRDPGVATEILAFFASFADIVKEFDYAPEFVKGLKENGYRVYLLSNYSRKHFQACKPYFRFLDYVDGGVISYEVEHIKPEPQIYQALIEKYEINPSEAVFLDDLAVNLEGARPFGFHTIQVKEQKQVIHELRQLGVRI